MSAIAWRLSSLRRKTTALSGTSRPESPRMNRRVLLRCNSLVFVFFGLSLSFAAQASGQQSELPPWNFAPVAAEARCTSGDAALCQAGPLAQPRNWHAISSCESSATICELGTSISEPVAGAIVGALVGFGVAAIECAELEGAICLPGYVVYAGAGAAAGFVVGVIVRAVRGG